MRIVAYLLHEIWRENTEADQNLPRINESHSAKQL